MGKVIVLGDTENEALNSSSIAKQLREFGFVIVYDTNFDPFYYNKFMNDAEVYFEKFLRLDGKDEFKKQRGFTPQLPFFQGDSDPLLRYFWSFGSATYEELGSNDLVPTGISDWKQTVSDCGSKMLGTVEAVAELAATGLKLGAKAISSKMTLGPHQLVCTGIDLGGVNEGTVLEPPHVDMNLLTIQGRNKYLGLHIWSKQGQKVAINIPIDHFLILAGKQLEHLTGGEVVAPKHEVAILQNTMDELIRNKEAKDRRISLWRISSTVFAHVGVNTMLNPVGAYGSHESFKKYPPKSAGQYIEESFPEVFPTRPLTSDEIEEVLQYKKKNE